MPATARIRRRLHSMRLDHELAAGAPPSADEERRLEATWLLRRRSRDEIAQGLERAATPGPPGPAFLTSAAPVDGRAVRAARRDISKLAQDLRDLPECHARGVALARLLLVEAESPLYADRDGNLLARIAEARKALRDTPAP